MGIITNADVNAAGLQIKSWEIESIESINTVKRNLNSLIIQFENMQTNSDYTQEDITEMNVLIENLRIRITELNF